MFLLSAASRIQLHLERDSVHRHHQTVLPQCKAPPRGSTPCSGRWAGLSREAVLSDCDAPAADCQRVDSTLLHSTGESVSVLIQHYYILLVSLSAC